MYAPHPDDGMPSSFYPPSSAAAHISMSTVTDDQVAMVKSTSTVRMDPRADALQHEWSADVPRTFRQDLAHVINKHSKENGSNTPDFILAQYLEECLAAFDKAARARDRLPVLQEHGSLSKGIVGTL